MKTILFFTIALFITTIAAAEERKTTITLRVLASSALVTLSTTDLLQTTSCVQAHTCVERNPIMKPVANSITKMAVVKGITTGAVITTAWKNRHAHPKLCWAALLSSIAIQGYVVTSNARQLHRQR